MVYYKRTFLFIYTHIHTHESARARTRAHTLTHCLSLSLSLTLSSHTNIQTLIQSADTGPTSPCTEPGDYTLLTIPIIINIFTKRWFNYANIRKNNFTWIINHLVTFFKPFSFINKSRFNYNSLNFIFFLDSIDKTSNLRKMARNKFKIF